MRPGDLALFHDTDFTAKVIHGVTHSHWNHAAIITGEDGATIEATREGVHRSALAGEYHIIDTGLTDAQRGIAIAFAASCLGQRYGFLQIASIGLAKLTRSNIVFGLDGTEICSGLCARALEHAGVIFQYDAAHMSPGDLARFYQIQPE